MSGLQRGEKWRLTKMQIPLGGGMERIPAGTVVTVVEPTMDHLDWFCCSVRLPDGTLRRFPWALDKYAERV